MLSAIAEIRNRETGSVLSSKATLTVTTGVTETIKVMMPAVK